MATWQCDFLLLPKPKLILIFGSIPQELEIDSLLDINWWEGYQPPKDYDKVISSFLVQHRSWDNDLKTWGHEDGNRVDVWLSQYGVQEVLFRIDVREIDLGLIEDINDFARFCNGVFLSSSNKLFEPNIKNFLTEVRTSRACRFVENPSEFLDDISRNH